MLNLFQHLYKILKLIQDDIYYSFFIHIMLIAINGLKINYLVEGEGQNILLLHGWGGCIDSWYPITMHLKSKYKVWVVDLPGFGKSHAPKTAFKISDYAEFLRAFIYENKIYNPVVIGHSFGGSISAYLAFKYPDSLNKLILVDASGIRINSLSKMIFHYFTELARHFKNKKLWSHYYFVTRHILYNTIFKDNDYNQAGKLKETLIKVINEDIRPNVSKIHLPTLIVWGEKDRSTPLWMARKFQKLIVNSKLIIIPHTGHFSYLENPERFCEEVEKFIDKNSNK